MSSDCKKHIFSAEEKKTFWDIVRRYSVVELKDTDGETLNAKKHAWECIAKEYNASPHTRKKVTNKQLRRLFMNLKHRERQKESQKERLNGTIKRDLSTTIDPLKQADIVEVTPTFTVGIDEDQLHDLEMQVMVERLREAKAKAREAEAKAREAEAKAELAELVLARQRVDLGYTCED